MNENITLEAYREQWLDDILKNTPGSQLIKQRFARKILSQWKNLSDIEETWISTNELSELGIDLAYFQQGKVADEGISGDTWFLVKSCYEGPLLRYKGSLFDDGVKILALIDKKQENVPKDLDGLFNTLETFWLRSVDKFTNDRIVLVFVSDQPISDKQTGEIKELIDFARKKLGTMIEVEFLSIKTIYVDAVRENEFADHTPLKVPMSANLSPSDSNLLVGVIKLRDLYWFLRDYKIQTGNLDQIFEKNIRQFLGLGSNRPINRAMQGTLLDEPSQFGLYNNGVTVVVEGFEKIASDHYMLFEPYIVNGCQTTRTIWEVFRQQHESGRKGVTAELKKWQEQISEGLVVIKIVTVGNEGEKLLHRITRYTNSQNAIQERDFITLEKGLERFQSELAEKYNVFLEIQRGEWDSQKARQKASKFSTHSFTKFANMFELLKVYGAGWLREPGTAFLANERFLPGGDLYRQIILERQPSFSVDDIFATFNLYMAGYNKFGYKAQKITRRQTRYLFYTISIDLLRDVLMREGLPHSAHNITNAILKLVKTSEKAAWDSLIQSALNTVDEYLTQGETESIFNEPLFDKEFNRDLNAYLKWSKLAQPDMSPKFAELMAINKRLMARGQPSPRELIAESINS